jgi:hypothetical protein
MAMDIDNKNSTNKWQDEEASEMLQLLEYQKILLTTERDVRFCEVLWGYKSIRFYVIYDIKHDGRHQPRLVSGTHLTYQRKDIVYLGVISLWSIRLIFFLVELKVLNLEGDDLGNLYLETKSKRRV